MGSHCKILFLVLFLFPFISYALPNESLHKLRPISVNVFGCSENGEPELQEVLLSTDNDWMLGEPVKVFLDPKAIKLLEPGQMRFTVVLDCKGRFVGVNVR